jgi:peptide methionine sulfoxide reductase MsrA
VQRATGHTEVVLVVYDPTVITDEELLGVFLEGPQPTKGLIEGSEFGTKYRSAIYRTSAKQAATTSEVADRFQDSLQHARYGTITLRSRRRGSSIARSRTTSSTSKRIPAVIAAPRNGLCAQLTHPE